MKVSEVLELCRLYEDLKAGGRNCKNINSVYKTLDNPKHQATKNQKIKEIRACFENLADNTIKTYLINKQIPDGKEYSGYTIQR
jgi:hypothetical protein